MASCAFRWAPGRMPLPRRNSLRSCGFPRERHAPRCPPAACDDSGVLFELEHVSMRGGDREVLDDVSAGIPAGATAIVGPSGAGKSTLLRLLDRLADPDAGTITYRGRPLAEYEPLALRREVSLVPQLPALLEGTVESNLAYAADLAGKELDAEGTLARAGLDPSFA